MKRLFVFVFAVVLLGSCQKDKNLPVISTAPIVYNNGITAQTGGVISSDGGSDITLRGVCWSTSPNPTIANDTTINGYGTGVFSSGIYGLSPLTTYYVRAYATNANGTAYGDELSFSTNLEIGSSYQGGIVFYLDGNGGGLIAASSDQSTGAEWGCANTYIGSTGEAIGTGFQNTISIEALCPTAGTAADICANLTLNGYNDWFLPSREELILMYENIGQGNVLGLGNIGGFTSSYYWSSSEVDIALTNGIYRGYAWRQSFISGASNDYRKNADFFVRAVRAF